MKKLNPKYVWTGLVSLLLMLATSVVTALLSEGGAAPQWANFWYAVQALTTVGLIIVGYITYTNSVRPRVIMFTERAADIPAFNGKVQVGMRKSPSIIIIIENYSNSPAFDVKVRLLEAPKIPFGIESQNPESPEFYNLFEHWRPFTTGIPVLPAQRDFYTWLQSEAQDGSHNPSNFKVELTYKDRDGNRYTEELTVLGSDSHGDFFGSNSMRSNGSLVGRWETRRRPRN